jgi:copper(I)-binding protein
MDDHAIREQEAVIGYLWRNWPSGQRSLRVLAAAGTASAVIGIAACSPQPSGVSGTGEPGTAVAQPAAAEGITTEIADSIDVINARIPAPPEGSDTAQVEMTMADTNIAGPDTLREPSSPAARAVVFTSSGHAVPEVTIPVADGSSLTTGPPDPDRILLTGLRRPLRAGQTVAITLVFARAGQGALRVPVVPPVRQHVSAESSLGRCLAAATLDGAGASRAMPVPSSGTARSRQRSRVRPY